MCKMAHLIFRIIIVTHDSSHSLIINSSVLSNHDDDDDNYDRCIRQITESLRYIFLFFFFKEYYEIKQQSLI